MKQLFLALLFCSTALAQSHRVVVEHETPAASDTTRRMVIDPGALLYEMQVDSIHQVTEEKIRRLIAQLEKKFDDPKVEEEVGKLIGEAVIEQQMALLDLQIERAISVKDTLLLKGLEIALRELLLNSDVVREQVEEQLRALENEMNKP